MSEDFEKLDEKTLPLLERAKMGDSAAVGDLYSLYEKRLKNAVRKKIGNKLRQRMETVDLVQSVWKDVLSDMKGFEYRGSDSFFKWLLSCIIRKIQDKGRYFKAKKRDIGMETRIKTVDLKPNSGRLEGTGPSPSQVAMTDEHIEKLLKLLDRLPDSQRQALVLRMKEEMEFEKIAQIMDRSQDSVRKLYSRAVKNIGKIMLNERNPD